MMMGVTSLRPTPSPPSEVATTRTERSIRWVAYALFAAGAALRLSVMQRLPFEQDELYSVIEARWLFDSPLNPGIHARPLYYLMQHLLLDAFPVTHLTMRLLPVGFGIAGIVVTWILARRILGTTAAMLATLLVAVSPWHLHASGMARYWSLIYLLSALFLLFLLQARKYGKPRDYIIALICLLLGTASHPTFFFPVTGIALGAYMIRENNRIGLPIPDRSSMLYLWIPALIALGGAYVLLSATQGGSAVRNWDGRGLAATLRLVPAMVEWAVPAVLAMGAMGALALSGPSNGQNRRTFGLAATLGVIAGGAALLTASLVTDVYADYGITMLPLVFVSAGGLAQLASERMRTSPLLVAGISGIVLTAAVAPGTVSYLSDGTRFDYRPAFGRIRQEAPDLAVLTAPIIVQRHYAPSLRGIELRFERNLLEHVLGEEGDLWLIAPVRRYGIWQDANGELAAWLVDRCRLDSSYQRPRFDYRLYRTDLYRCALPTVE